MSARGAARSIRSRVGRLEAGRRAGAAAAAGPCRVCGGGGYPGLFVGDHAGAEPRQVGTGVCPGCGKVGVSAVVVLAGAQRWAGGADDHGGDGL